MFRLTLRILLKCFLQLSIMFGWLKKSCTRATYRFLSKPRCGRMVLRSANSIYFRNINKMSVP